MYARKNTWATCCSGRIRSLEQVSCASTPVGTDRSWRTSESTRWTDGSQARSAASAASVSGKIQNTGGVGLNNMEVRLYVQTPKGFTGGATTTTDAMGLYSFTSVMEGIAGRRAPAACAGTTRANI